MKRRKKGTPTKKKRQGERERKNVKVMSSEDMVAEHLTGSKCPACWSKKVAVGAPIVGPFDEASIICMSCGNTWIVEGDEATQAIKWEYRRCGCRPAKISDEDAAILDDDGNDIFKDDNREPLERCPECEGEKLIKLVPISQNDEVLYECTMCHFIAKIKENEIAETKFTRRPLVIRECAKCKTPGHHRVYIDNANLTIICKHSQFSKDSEAGRDILCRLNQDQTEDYFWNVYGRHALESISGKKKGGRPTSEETQKTPAIGKSCYIAIKKESDTAVWVLKDKAEYNKLADLCRDAEYNHKLIANYGFEKRTDEFDLDRFPVAKTDGLMERTKSNVVALKSFDELNKYKVYLARKYDILVGLEEARKCSRQCIYCPTFTLLEGVEDVILREDPLEFK